MKITAREIARRVGVSPATVSLVLRGKPGASEPVRQKILSMAAELGLAPRTGPSKAEQLIQLIIYKRHGKVMADTPFFDPPTEGMVEEAARLGYRLAVSYFYGSQPPEEQLKSIHSVKAAGAILLATEMHTADLAPFHELQMPLVLLDNYFPAARYDAIVIDNRCGVWNAVRHLIDCGHTQLGYLHSSVEIRNFRERYEGYLGGCRLLPESGAKDSARRVIQVAPSTEGALQDMLTYLATQPMVPSAFVADNDRIAAGCCRALVRYGYRIPQDVSVIGFDDSSTCPLLDPPLTTMGVQKRRMGALAVRRLEERLQTSPPESVRITVMPELVARQSVLNRNEPNS